MTSPTLERLQAECKRLRLLDYADALESAIATLDAENGRQALLLKGAVQRGGELIAENEKLKEQLAEKEAQLKEAEDYIIVVHRGLPYGLIKNNYERFCKIYESALTREEARTQNKETK